MGAGRLFAETEASAEATEPSNGDIPNIKWNVPFTARC